MIIERLAQAVEIASQRSEEEQELIASLILEELASGAQDKLASMANEALAEYRAGRTHALPI